MIRLVIGAQMGFFTANARRALSPFSIPTFLDHYEYLLRLYFGSDSDHLARCIARAYRDLNRTLHGIAHVPEGEDLRIRANAVVRAFLVRLANTTGEVYEQTAFD